MTAVADDLIASSIRLGVGPRDLATLITAALMVDDANAHGLIEVELELDRPLCRRTLRQLAAQGIEPTEEEALAKFLEILVELGARP